MNSKKIKDLYENEPQRSEIHKKIGISSSTLFYIMNGNGNPTIDNLEKIAKYFGKPISYFFDEENCKNTINQSVIENTNGNFQQGEYINDVRSFTTVITEIRKDYQETIKKQQEQIDKLIEVINKLSSK